MNNYPWLLIDVSFLAYRSVFTMKDLSFDGVKTGCIFGIFQTVLDLVDLFATDRICWCFDAGYSGRTAIDARYKANRKEEENEEIKEAKQEVFRQLLRLRTSYLTEIGFKNIFFQEGYEADDVIASLCQDLYKGETAIIVSPDHDLYQLLVQDKVSVWNPASSRAITAESFTDEWGIPPAMWPDVLAIAGCTGDGVVGISQVGPKGACQFLSGTLNSTTKKFKAIVQNNHVWKHNLQLVRLPFFGTNHFELIEDHLKEENWNKVFDDLGMKSLAGRSFRNR